jgi:hypothetical protein
MPILGRRIAYDFPARMSRRTTFIVIGGAFGAIASGCLGFLLVLLAASLAGDFALALMLFGMSSLLLVASVGGILGGFAGRRLAAVPYRTWIAEPASWFFFVLSLLGVGVAIYGFWVEPAQRLTEHRGDLKRQWRTERRAGMNEDAAKILVRSIDRCIAEHGAGAKALLKATCGLKPWHDATAGPNEPDSWQLDSGWRWRYVTAGTSWRIVVAPAVELERSGPIFEIEPDGRLFRRGDTLSPAVEIPR